MSRPTLLVLGGGTYQLPAIFAAKSAGLHVAVVDKFADAPGRAIADQFAQIDILDADGVSRFAAAIEADGIISPCTDVAIPTQAAAAARLGLPGPPAASAEILSNKLRFREFQKASGLPHPAWREVASADGLDAIEGRHILKPAASSGSKGIFVVDRHTVRDRLPETAEFSRNAPAILEQFVDGEQGTVEGVWVDGSIAMALVTDRMTVDLPYVATAGHRVPSRLATGLQQEVLRQIAEVLSKLEVPDTAFDCDFVAAPDAVILIELAPRLGGNSLSKLVNVATGIDLPLVSVYLSLAGRARSALVKPDIVPGPLRPSAVVILGASEDGLLSYCEEGLAGLRSEPWVHEIALDYEQGTPVRRFVNGRERLGEVVLSAQTREMLDQRCELALSRLKLTARPR